MTTEVRRMQHPGLSLIQLLHGLAAGTGIAAVPAAVYAAVMAMGASPPAVLTFIGEQSFLVAMLGGFSGALAAAGTYYLKLRSQKVTEKVTDEQLIAQERAALELIRKALWDDLQLELRRRDEEITRLRAVVLERDATITTLIKAKAAA